MASTSNSSRKRSLAEATQDQDEDEAIVEDNVRRRRPSVRQRQISKFTFWKYIRIHALMSNLR